MTDDFARLYAELGLHADCSIDVFTQACRRRIRQQHPDRLKTDADALDLRIPFEEVLLLYAQALRFHRVHGRLPGAALTPPPASRLRRIPMGRTRDQPRHIAPLSRHQQRSPRGARLLLAAGLIATTAAVAVIGLQARDATVPPPVSQAPRILLQRQLASDSREQLEIGMDIGTALDIQGEPMRRDGEEWMYGPSWLRFDDSHLVDWYSSPLHPLRTQTPSPPQELDEVQPPR